MLTHLHQDSLNRKEIFSAVLIYSFVEIYFSKGDIS
jgi:hypothetical protein